MTEVQGDMSRLISLIPHPAGGAGPLQRPAPANSSGCCAKGDASGAADAGPQAHRGHRAHPRRADLRWEDRAGRLRAVVVGAGFAGLAAADSLRREGVAVTVLEARDRVGGRVHSRRLENGAVIELGAEFILPGNTLVIEMADRFGLEVAEKGMRYGRREPRGGAPVDPEAFERAVAAVGDALQRPGGTGRESAAALLARLEIDPAAREAILARVEISSACPAGAVPATDLAGVAYIGDEPASGLAAGNQGLAEALATELGPALRLSEPVCRVAWGEGGVRVATAAGSELEAEACVDRGPAPRGRRDLLRAGAPRHRPPRRLSGMPYGQAAKLLVPLRAAVEPSAVISVPERYWAWTATGEGGQADGTGQLLQRLGGGAGGPRRRGGPREVARIAGPAPPGARATSPPERCWRAGMTTPGPVPPTRSRPRRTWSHRCGNRWARSPSPASTSAAATTA